MHILVLKHVECEHPGYFRQLLQEDGHQWTAVELDQGEALPPLDGFDALWVMGGPMDVWQEEEHPWLVAEKTYIRDAVMGRGMPFFGLCLGHQLLACALGGDCGKGTPEIGVMDVHLTETGAESLFFDGVDFPLKTLQWHGAEVTVLPEGAKVLATTEACPVQAMSWGPRALSMQFHMEVEADTVDMWSEIPEYRAALDSALGPDGVAQINAACAAEMGNFNKAAERIYMNWLQACAQGPGMR